MRRYVPFALLIAIILATGALVKLALARGQRAPGAAEEKQVAVPVSVAEAKLGTVEDSFVMDGTVEAITQVGVYAKVPGKISRIYVREGDWVRKGQLVAELERDELLAQLSQARAMLKSAEARLQQARQGSRLQRTQTSTSVEQAEAALAAARARLAQAQTGTQLTEEDVRTTVQAAEQAVRMAQARLDELRAGSRKQERRIAQERVKQAKANLDTARRNLERARKLLEAQAIGQQQFDAVKLQYDLAAADYQAALQQASLVEEGPRKEEIRAAEAQLEQAKAQLEKARALQLQVELRQRDIEAAREAVRQAEAALKLARASRIRDQMREQDIKAAEAAVEQARANIALIKAQIRNTYIRAPASGWVVKKFLEAGEMASPAVPIVTLVDNRTVKITCALTEARARYVYSGQQVEVRVDAVPGKVFIGRVRTVSAAADPQARAFSAEVRVPNPKGLLKAGMFARVRVVKQRQSGVVVIPYEAVVRRGERTLVFVVEGGVAKQREVKLGLRQGDIVAVLAGVSVGDQVVVRGQSELRDGQKVTVQRGGKQ